MPLSKLCVLPPFGLDVVGTEELGVSKSSVVPVFDREGYSPVFFADMWREHRIGYITCHKHPRGNWPGHWFTAETFTMPDGETVTVPPAEMGSLVGSGSNATWMREVRKLTNSGHQPSHWLGVGSEPCEGHTPSIGSQSLS